MKMDKLAVSIFIVGMCFIVPLAAVLVAIRLAKDVAHSTSRKFRLLRQAQKPMAIIDVYPTGDIPQPETSNIGHKLSMPR